MGQYDNITKRMIEADPRAIVELILQQAKIMGSVVIDVQMISDTQHLSTTFQGSDADADGLLLVTLADGRQFLVHIEFQVKPDQSMADRLLDYCLRARRKHRPEDGPPLPILSCAIYLRKVGKVPEPPLVWELFDGQKNLVFDYLSIKLHDLPREEILALKQPGLLPLSLLTQGDINRIIVKEMFEELLANKLYDLLPIGQTVASWVLGPANLEWIKKEYYKMLDFFKDSPAYEWMTKDAREEGLEQGREEARRQIEEARQRELRTLNASRQTVVTLVAERFPQLARLAKKQVERIENPETLQKVILFIFATQDAGELGVFLANLGED